MMNTKKPKIYQPPNPLAKLRFRAAVRHVIHNLEWINDEDIDESLGDNARKNIKILLNKKMGKKGFLTVSMRRVLLTPPEKRTEEDIKEIKHILDKIKYFRHFPRPLKDKILKYIHFECYPPDRTLIHQENMPLKMYVLVKGRCSCKSKRFCKVQGKWVTEFFRDESEGNVFGDISLLLNMKRPRSFITKSYSEFLVITKETFDLLIKGIALQQWNKLIAIIDGFEYFKDWDLETKQDCAIIARFSEFKDKETIFSKDIGYKHNVYFIISGTCYMIEQVFLETSQVGSRTEYKLLKPPNNDSDYSISDQPSFILPRKTDKTLLSNDDFRRIHFSHGCTEELLRNPTVRIMFFKVCEFKKHACFNLGEPLEKRTIIAKEKVQLLLIPYFWLLRRNKGNIWNRIRNYLMNKIPSTEEIFTSFKEEMKWSKYKANLVQDGISATSVKINTYHNVPYSIRLQNGYRYSEE